MLRYREAPSRLARLLNLANENGPSSALPAGARFCYDSLLDRLQAAAGRHQQRVQHLSTVSGRASYCAQLGGRAWSSSAAEAAVAAEADKQAVGSVHTQEREAVLRCLEQEGGLAPEQAQRVWTKAATTTLRASTVLFSFMLRCATAALLPV